MKARVKMRGRTAAVRLRSAAVAVPALTVALLAFHAAGAVATAPCSDDFTGPSGGLWGSAGDWTSATDSSVHAVPGSGDVVCLGGVNVVIGSATAHADSVQGQGGGLQLDGGSLALSSAADDSTIASLSLDQAGALTAPLTQTITVSGDIEWGGCTSCGNSLTIDATIVQTAGDGGSLLVDGPGTGISGPILSAGSISTDSPVSITNPSFEADGTSALDTSSTITLGSAVQLDGNSEAATFTAAGLVTPTGTAGFGPASLILAGGTTFIGHNTTLQAGAVTLQAGVLDDDGVLEEAPGDSQSLTIAGGTLEGVGHVQGPVTNVSGIVAPGETTPGTLTMAGSFTQDSGGVLQIGLGPTSTFGQLQVSGAVTAGGQLVPELGSYAPAQGQVWVVVTSLASLSGTFALTGADADSVSAVYGSRSVQLEASAATGTGTSTTTTATTTTGTTSTGTGTTTTPAAGGSGETAPVPGCLPARGRISSTAVGPLALGETRAAARRAIPRYTALPGGIDDFCLSGGEGIRVGYPSAKMLRGASKRAARQLNGRIVLALTANPFYSVGGIRPGARVARFAAALRRAAKLKLGGNTWYLTPSHGHGRGVVEVHGAVVRMVGLVDSRLPSGGRSALFSSFAASA